MPQKKRTKTQETENKVAALFFLRLVSNTWIVKKMMDKAPSNTDVINTIKRMEKVVTTKINGVLSAMKEVKVGEVEEQISSTEDNIAQLQSLWKLKSSLYLRRRTTWNDKAGGIIWEMVGWPQKEEGQDPCTFLGSWQLKILWTATSSPPLVIKRRADPSSWAAAVTSSCAAAVLSSCAAAVLSSCTAAIC